MIKLYIYLTLLTLVCAKESSEGTEGFYFSPRGIIGQRQVRDALQRVIPKIQIQKTRYQYAGIDYTINDFALEVTYLDENQNTEISQYEDVDVHGGNLEILYKFNFVKRVEGLVVHGKAEGSVISDPLLYTKSLTFNKQAFLIWALLDMQSFSNLTIQDRMRLKRIKPYNQTDLKALESMLDQSNGRIKPSTIKEQFLSSFNSLMPINLNATLNPYILGKQIDYTFNHQQKGEQKMSIEHLIYGFNIDPVEGYKIIFYTRIKDWQNPICDDQTVPKKHLPVDLYGNYQSIHLNCLYQSVLDYIQSKGWLDVNLGPSWNSDALQFYSENFYHLIHNLEARVNPGEVIEGECKAQDNEIKLSRQFGPNMFSVDIEYKCSLSTIDKQERKIQVGDFTVIARLIVEVTANKTELEFTIKAGGEAIYMSFRTVGEFYFTVGGRQSIALLKNVLGKLEGQKVFGTGFPTIPRQSPKTQLNADYVVFYDDSHRKSNLSEQ